VKVHTSITAGLKITHCNNFTLIFLYATISSKQDLLSSSSDYTFQRLNRSFVIPYDEAEEIPNRTECPREYESRAARVINWHKVDREVAQH